MSDYSGEGREVLGKKVKKLFSESSCSPTTFSSFIIHNF
jgi:hypothetical protein